MHAHTHTGPFAFIPLTPDCTSLLCPMSATANALLSWSLQFQNSCRVDVIYCTGSCQACAMTDLCSFWRWVQANCWSHPCCIVLQLPGPVPTSRRWRMRSGIWSQRKRCRPTCCQLRGKSSCNWRWMPGRRSRHSVMLRRGHSMQRQRLTSIAMRVSGPSARPQFPCVWD